MRRTLLLTPLLALVAAFVGFVLTGLWVTECVVNGDWWGDAEVSVPSWAKVAPEQIAEAKKHGVPVAFENDLGMRFVLIPAGTFVMGSPEAERQRMLPDAYLNVGPLTGDNVDTSRLGPAPGASSAAERRRAKLERLQDEVRHQVTLARPYYMQITETLYSQHARMCPSRRLEGGDFTGMVGEDPFPVDLLSWEDGAAFARALSEHDLEREYVLPTEAQWEYACRAGTTTAYSFGESATLHDATVSDLCNAGVGNFNGPPVRSAVASFGPNRWGLYDMHGNLAEFCSDWYAPYSESTVVDPVGPGKGQCRVLRGGSGWEFPERARSAARAGIEPDRINHDAGVRLVSPMPER